MKFRVWDPLNQSEEKADIFDIDCGIEEDAAEITALLASLGNTADEVADELRRRGVKGKRGKRRSCPIARLTGAAVDEDWYDLGGVRVSLPRAVSSFVDLFDRGFYPYLVER